MLFFQHMKPKSLVAAILFLFLAAGCASRPVARDQAFEAPAANGPRLPGSFTGSADDQPPGRVPPATGPGIARKDSVAPDRLSPYSSAPPTGRPGLATRWGETRDSRISLTSFKRRDGNDPMEQERILYNNRVGLDSLWAQSIGNPLLMDAPTRLQWADLDYGFRGQDDRWLPAWKQGGQVFVEGRSGERYSIVLRNRASVRREVVVSVDGLDVLDGAPASLRRRGYVLAPGEEFAVEGFRKSPDEVAAFEFGSVDDSYAQRRHGNVRNVGVVGIAVFAEADTEADRRRDADAFPGRWALPPGR